MLDPRHSDNDLSKRDIPSFIEPMPPLISNPFMRPRPQKGTNLLELFEEDSEIEEPELVQVYLRLKPYHARNNLYEVRSNRCLITSVDTATAGHGRRTQHNVSKMYTFSHIFGPESTQKEIFENVVKDNLRKLPNGHNFTLLTYGASGSGKTYTLMGTVASPGLVPRSLEYVFRVVDAAQQPLYKPADGGSGKLNYAEQEYEMQWVKRLRHVSAPLREKYRRMSAGLCNDLTASTIDLSNRTRHYVWVSFVEIYNEGIYDLLAPGDRRNAPKLRIREDHTGNVFVKDVTQAFVRSGEEAYDVMVAGKHNLQVAATGIHAQSSRSHCIFTITMLTETESGVRTSCVRLCDLAGCERARHTRNTGARMAESRAINGSLHVLERCLHTLRRRAPACPPYRESKLTRLLGAGLSGARGESVSMVVTLNPAPEFAHESRHVLQLAAVARDIQVNSTIAESSLETTQDSTVCSSAMVMQLRSDNERLHFELVQAQARNKELMASMEERQQEAAATMRELVEEAKDMTRQYYEAQLRSLRTEMEDMAEEYESRLNKQSTQTVVDAGTPSRSLQKKVVQLMAEIAILEEKLTAERLARARAEEEVHHLRACIDERDEKSYGENASQNKEDVMLLSDSEHDSEEEVDDPCNESLEPTFKKEDINRSKLIIQKAFDQSMRSHGSFEDNNETIENADDNHDSVINKTGDTLKDCDVTESTKESMYATGEDTASTDKTADVHGHQDDTNHVSHTIQHTTKSDETYESITNDDYNNTFDKTENLSKTVQDEFGTVDDMQVSKKESAPRGTYFVRSNETGHDADVSSDEIVIATSDSLARGTYFVRASQCTTNPSSINIDNDDNANVSVVSPMDNIEEPIVPELIDNKILKSIKPLSYDSNTSLAQFEQLEKAAKTCYDRKSHESEDFGNVNSLKVRKNYFEEDCSEESKLRKPVLSGSLPKDVDANDIPIIPGLKIMKEKRTYFEKECSEESKAYKSVISDSLPKDIDANELISVPKIIKEKRTYFENDCPKEPQACTSVINEPQSKNMDKNEIIPVLNNKEKGTCVENDCSEEQKTCNSVDEHLSKDTEENELIPVPKIIKEKRTYFDNIDVNIESAPNKKLNELADEVNLQVDDTRSPSIVKDDITNEFKPSTIKKLLGESFSRQPDVISSVHKNKLIYKKHDSVDIFDGLDSPQLPIKTSDTDIVENARKSIEKLVLNQKSASKLKLEIKMERELIAEEHIEAIAKPTDTSSEEFVKPADKNVKDKSRKTKLNQDVKADNAQPHNESIKANNTIEEFEKLCKDISSRATEFELLVSHNSTDVSVDQKTNEETKYNLRHKHQGKADGVKFSDKMEKQEFDEVLQESHAKCESKAKPTKRSLRLRKRKNHEDTSDQEGDRLKDIVNLQKEFSDVTMDVPAPVKEVKDMESPEKVAGETENVPPLMGIQSCPSKSVTRSRRKLFTPRAEPLDESQTQADSGERIYVPRPSYHRARARRKL